MRRLLLVPLVIALLAGCTSAPPGTPAPSAVSSAEPSTVPSAEPSTFPSSEPSTSPVPSVTASVQPTVAGPRLVPPDGVLVGVNIDWGADSPDAIDSRLGRTPAVWVQFVGFPFSPTDRTNLAGFFEAVEAQHGIALLTIEPNAGLAAVDDTAIADLVTVVAGANDAGVPVLVRFAHEMNGSWYAWGEQPAAYVATFRRVAAAIHAGAPRAAMLWAPNDGGGYPFAGGPYEAKPGTTEFALLDTNDDGQLSMDDDPYAPYYPGDEAVDWVGMSLYHWGDRWPWGRNVLPEDGKFAAKLTGTYDGTAGDERALPDFYATYAVEHGKPMAIPETAAFYRPDLEDGAGELALKRAWWRQVFSADTLERFPQIRLVDWFDQRKFETEVNDVVDWRLTGRVRVASAFLADLPPAFRFASAP